MLRWLGVVWFCLVTTAVVGVAEADNSFNHIAEDKRYEVLVVEIVKDSDKEVCIKLGGRPEVHCYLKPNHTVSSFKM